MTPQTKNQKRLNAILLFERALDHWQYALHTYPSSVKDEKYKRFESLAQSKINNLHRHITLTRAAVEPGKA